MKRITPRSFVTGATLALVAAVGLVVSAVAAPNPVPNSAIVKTRIFNDCPTSTITVTNNYPSSVKIEDAHLDCFGFANLHNWHFSADGGATSAQFDNNSSFRFSADVAINGSGDGEAGLQISPWFSPDVDGRFNIRTPDGEIACFGGRLPFYSFTAAFGLHYAKGQTIRLGMEYDPHSLNAGAPGTIIYTVDYQGTSYTSGPLPFDQANPAEDPPHGLYGILNTAQVGGYFQPRLANGVDVTTAASWNNIAYSTTPVPNSAVTRTRIFNDCPTSTVTVTNNYPSLISIEDAHLDCFGFANLHNWSFSENGADGAIFNNNSEFRYSTDLVISGTGNGEAGLRIAPWFSQDVDGRFNVRTPDGEVAVFGGRLPFYSFTAAFGIHYAAGQVIHLEVSYDPHSLTDGDGGTVTYGVGYQGTNYTSGPLSFDKGNLAEEAQHGVWGILNDARVGGYFQPRLGNGLDVAVKATWSNIRFTSTCLTPAEVALDFKPHDLNLRSNSHFITVLLTPTAPATAAQINPSTITLNGVSPVTSPGPKLENGGATLRIRFLRSDVKATLHSGSSPILVTGDLGGGCFEAIENVNVSAPQLISPVAGAVLTAGATASVDWQTPADMQVQSVTLMSSFDDGQTWQIEAQGLPNTGHYAWTVPQTQTGTARLSIDAISMDDLGPVTESEYAVSDPFTIHSTTGVGDVAVSFALRGIMPNPARGPMNVNFSLPTRERATLGLYDVTGRQVAFREVGTLGAGNHSISFGARAALRPGVYMVRLTQGAKSLTTRAVVIE